MAECRPLTEIQNTALPAAWSKTPFHFHSVGGNVESFNTSAKRSAISRAGRRYVWSDPTRVQMCSSWGETSTLQDLTVSRQCHLILSPHL